MTKMWVLGVGLPKCGTTSLSGALTTNGLHVGHQHTGRAIVPPSRGFGPRMIESWKAGEDPLAYLDETGFNGATQLDFVNDVVSVWAQMEYAMLEEVHARHPDCWFLLPTRPLRDHVRSIQNYARGRFFSRITRQGAPGLPPGAAKDPDLLGNWITRHYAGIRELCRGWNFVEFDIRESSEPARVLHETLGVRVSWRWRQRNHSLDGTRVGERR